MKKTAPLAAPLDVYLDSQDYSRLASGRPEHERTHEALVTLRNAGLARYLFSDVLLFECLPVDPANATVSLARIATMANLTQGAHLPGSGNLMDFELDKLLLQARGQGKMPRLSREWFSAAGWDDDPLQEARTKFVGDLRATRGLSRNERRAAIKRASRTIAKTSKEEWVAAGLSVLFENNPLRQEDEARVLYALRKRAPSNVFHEIIRDGLRDIVNFAGWAVRNWKQARIFIDGLRTPGLGVQSTMVEFADRMRTMHVETNGAFAQEQLAKVAEASFQEWLVRAPVQRLAARGNVPAEVLAKLPPISVATTPSLYAAHDFYSRVMLESAREVNPRNPGKKKPSDFADGLHALYLPHVDIFRADRFAATLLRRSPALGSTLVCESLEDLPSLIESLAATRGLGTRDGEGLDDRPFSA